MLALLLLAKTLVRITWRSILWRDLVIFFLDILSVFPNNRGQKRMISSSMAFMTGWIQEMRAELTCPESFLSTRL